MTILTKYQKSAIALLVLLAFLIPLQRAEAQIFSIEGIASHVFGSFFYYIGYALSFLGGVVFAFGAFLAGIALELNFRLFGPENQLIRTGWTIVRDVANLGFVLVIIIIAVATILRFEQYGVKKLLPKLIAAAIIVNFSFTIAAVFVDFSHVLTDFFFSKISKNPLEIASSVAGAFNPQGLFKIPTDPNTVENASILETITVGVVSLVFVTVFTLIGAFTLIALAFMLLLRYLQLTFLVILSPIVWLFWVVPNLASQFNAWWHKFLQWVFFAPASAFFIYLALVSAKALKSQTNIYTAGTGVFGNLASVLSDVVSKGAQMVVLSGIMLGGLIIAQKMGIKGAAGAMAMASNVGGKVKGVARDIAGRQYRRFEVGALGLAEKPIKRLAGFGAELGKGRGFAGTVGKVFKVATAPIRGAGLGLYNYSAGRGRKVIDDEGNRFKDLSDQTAAGLFNTLNPRGQIALLNRLTKNGTLHHLSLEAGKDPYEFITQEWKNKFKNFNLDKEFGDLQKGVGMNVATHEALISGDTDKADDESKKFFASFSPSDFSKLQANTVFSKKTSSDLQQLVARGIAINNPGDFGRVFMNAKGENRGYVQESFGKVATELYSVAGATGSDEMMQSAKDLSEAIRGTLAAKRLSGFVPGEVQQAVGVPTPPVAGAPPPPAAAAPKP